MLDHLKIRYNVLYKFGLFSRLEGPHDPSDLTDPSDPSIPTVPSVPDVPSKPDGDTNNSGNGQDTGSVPTTGNDTNYALGILMTCICSLAMLFTQRKNKRQSSK